MIDNEKYTVKKLTIELLDRLHMRRGTWSWQLEMELEGGTIIAMEIREFAIQNATRVNIDYRWGKLIRKDQKITVKPKDEDTALLVEIVDGGWKKSLIIVGDAEKPDLKKERIKKRLLTLQENLEHHKGITDDYEEQIRNLERELDE